MPTQGSTRAQLRIDALNIADANSNGGPSHWDTTPGGEVDRRLGIVHMQEWRRILNASPYFQTATLSPTTDANGNVPLTALSTGSGDAQQNCYRVLAVAQGTSSTMGLYYSEVKTQEIQQFLLIAKLGVVYNVWFRNGPNLVIPGNLNTVLSIFVNYTPTRFDQLASDASLVALPDDYGDIFAFEGAARLLMKGGAETQASADLKGQAEELRRDRLQDLSRLGIAPWTVAADDNRWDWGSQ